MTLEQLRALDAVVTCGSVRAASSKLYKTAPAISSLIKNLEVDLELQLLDRADYRPKLTAQGEIFYSKARQLLQQADELNSLSQRIRGHKELIINIAVNAVCPLEVILPTLLRIEANHQCTQLNISSEHMGGAIERLRHGTADLAITTTSHLDMRTMEATPFMDVTILPVANRDHVLSQVKTMISREEAKQFSQVIVRDTSRKDEKVSLDVVEGGRHCYVTDFSAKKAIIDAGLGWGGLPEYLISDSLTAGDLQVLSVEGFEPRLSQLFVIRRNDGKHGPVAQDFWENLKQVFSKPA